MQPIFIGDVQGCAEELEELLARARAHTPRAFTHGWSADLVNRGPGSLAVLRRVRELVDAGRARTVLGNHEIGLLMTAAGLREQKPLDSFGDVLGASDAAQWLEWLRRRPLLEVGQLGRQRFAMVHAAVHPDWSLRRARAAGEAGRGAPRGAGSARGHRVARAPIRAATKIGICSAASRSAAASRRRAAGRRSCRAAPSRSGTAVGPRVAMITAWCMGTGRCRACTSRRACAASIPAACTTGAGATERSRRGSPDPDAAIPFERPDERFWQIPARRVYYSDARP